MRIKNGYIVRQIAGQYVAVPTEGDVDLSLMITLNETGAFLWERLQNDTDEAALVAALLEEYDVDEETAKQSVQAFVKKLSDNEFLC